MLFVGDDWAEDHHDVEIVDETGRTLARRRFPEGLAGITRLHALIAEHLPEPAGPADPAPQVVVGIETERGPWAAALVAAGYRVFAINPMSSARYRERHSTSGAKSDAADAHLLAEIVRLDRAHHRQVAGDSALAEAVKLAARTHQSLVWDRTRQILRLRSALREFFPAALKAYNDLDAADTLQLLRLAPDPDQAARLTKRQVLAALARANRRNPEVVAEQIMAVLRAGELRQAPPVQAAFAAIVAAQVEVITTLNNQIDTLGEVVADHFGHHRDAELITSLPGLGVILAARVLGEFGDDPSRYVDAKARKAYAGTAPITRAFRHQEGRDGPLRPQQTPRRRPAAMGVLFDARLLRRQGLLQGTPDQEDRPPSRAAPARQPLGRHPPWLPEDRPALQRNTRLEPPHQRRRLTSKNLGCLPRT